MTHDCLQLPELIMFMMRYMESFSYTQGIFEMIASNGNSFHWMWTPTEEAFCLVESA